MRKKHLRKIFAVISAAFTLVLVFVLPSSATTIPDADDHSSPTYYALPLVEGEYLGAVNDVYTWYGIEYTAEGCSTGMASLGARSAMIASRDGYYYVDTESVTVHVTFGGAWTDITNETITNRADKNRLWGVYCDTERNPLTNVTYGEAFSQYCGYSLAQTNVTAFGVRWEATNESGNVRKYCYIGYLTHIEANPAMNNLSPEARCPYIWYVGLNNPEVAYRLGLESTYEEIDELNAEIERLRAELDEGGGYDLGYQDGYNEGLLNGGGYTLDTSTPWATFISMTSAWFIGIRNLVMPILTIEIAGVSLLTLLGYMALAVTVALVISFVLAVKG